MPKANVGGNYGGHGHRDLDDDILDIDQSLEFRMMRGGDMNETLWEEYKAAMRNITRFGSRFSDMASHGQGQNAWPCS